MKQTALFLAAMSLTLGPAVFATEEKPKAPSKAPTPEEIQEMWMKHAAPGEPHAQLKPLAGSWNLVVKSWDGPGDPKISEGSCESAWVLGDRFIRQECTGSMAGMPFEGMGFTGYDNVQKRYVSAWIDNMGTGIMMSEGKMDLRARTITFRSRMPDPTNPTSGKTVPVKMVTKIIDENSHTFTIYGMREGKEAPQMEITYTRK